MGIPPYLEVGSKSLHKTKAEPEKNISIYKPIYLSNLNLEATRKRVYLKVCFLTFVRALFATWFQVIDLIALQQPK